MDILSTDLCEKLMEQLTDWERSFFSQEDIVLYKYRGDIFRDILTIKNNQIYIPTIDELNDPNESCLNMHSTLEELGSVEKRLDSFIDMYKQKGFKDTESIEKQRAALVKDANKTKMNLHNIMENGYFSLCKKKDIECLWSYYANNHKGFCIEYDINELKKTIKYKFIFEVKYTSEKLDPEYGELIKKLDDLITFTRDLTASKSKAWEKEEEVRIITYNNGYADITPEAIRSIYIGAKCSDRDKELIIRSLKDKNINFYQMKFKHDSFTMVSELIKT